MNMGRIIKLMILIVAILFFVIPAWAERLEVWGSTTCQKRFLEPGAKAFKEKTGIELKVVGVGTGKGLIALVEDRAPVSAASEDLESAIHSAKKAAKKMGKVITIPGNLQYHEITRDVIVPIVHKDNPIDSLTWEQLKAINTGKIKNWKEVGGPDLPIRVITSHAGSATRAVFQKLVMNGEEYTPDAVKVVSTRLEVREVSKYRGAIGAVSLGFVKMNPGRTHIIKTDPITRPLGLITIGEPSENVKRLIDFFRSDEGKKYIK